MTLNTKDLGAGLVFVAIGGLFAAGALTLDLGTAFRMGPGYFPLMLAGLLIAIGLVIAANGFRRTDAASPPAGEARSVPRRGLVLILAALVVFGATLRGLGLVPVLALARLLSSFSPPAGSTPAGSPPEGEARRPVPWRGLVLILAAPVVFGATVRGLGLVPALALVVLLSAFASRRMTVPLALALTLGLTVFCVLVFSYGLGLSIRLFGPWLAF